jgi:hypothetical protein
MSAAPKVRMPRIIRQLEYGLVIVAVVFLGQLLFVSMRLHETENRPTVNSEKDLSKVLYMDDIVKKAELSASAKAAPLQGGTAEATGSDKSFVKGQKKESQSLQLPAAKASKSVKEDVKRTKKKHRRRKRNSWDPGTQGLKGDPISLKINLPVFVPSLPKSGTTSIWQYFNCKYCKTLRHEMSCTTPFSLLSFHLKYRWWTPSLSPMGKGERHGIDPVGPMYSAERRTGAATFRRLWYL